MHEIVVVLLHCALIQQKYVLVVVACIKVLIQRAKRWSRVEQ